MKGLGEYANLKFMKIICFIKRTKFSSLLAVAFIYNLILKLFFEQLAYVLTTDEPLSSNLNMDLAGKILLGVGIVPFIESFLFVFLIIEIYSWLFFDKLKINRNPLTYFPPIVLSTVLFVLCHNRNMFHIIYAIAGGIAYASVYVIAKGRKEHSFWLVYAMHACWNMFVLIYNELGFGT